MFGPVLEAYFEIFFSQKNKNTIVLTFLYVFIKNAIFTQIFTV